MNGRKSMSFAQSHAIFGLSRSAFAFSAWETGFVASLVKQREEGRTLSQKQAAALGRLLNKMKPWRAAMTQRELQAAARHQSSKRERWFHNRRMETFGSPRR